MKRIISFVLVSILLIGCINVAIAEEFQLRNGIHFGDDLEIVKSKETLTIEDSSKDKTNNIWFDGKIAGMQGSVRYDFDEETGKLIEMLYIFDETTSKESVDSDYTTLYQSLIRKYGNPLGNTGGSIHTITGTVFTYWATVKWLTELLDGKNDYRDYDEWIVNCDGYNVKIDLLSWYDRDSNYKYKYRNGLSYHYYTDEDFLNKIQEKLDENAAVDNDL